MNALVLYVGTQAIAFIHSKGNTPSTSTIAHTAHMDIFQQLVVDLDTEGTHVVWSGIACLKDCLASYGPAVQSIVPEIHSNSINST